MKRVLSLVCAMSLFCGAGFAQSKDVMVVRQTDGNEVRFDVTKVEKVYVTTEEQTPEPESIDMGLSVKWASFNLGASKPEECGDYYGWGCTEAYAEGEDVTWAWALYFQKLGGTGTSMDDCGTDKDPLKEYFETNGHNIAGTKWDAARQKLGGAWRMPTRDEIDELVNEENCSWSKTTENGVNGYMVTSKKNGNSIFLPAAGRRQYGNEDLVGELGCYWGASPDARFSNAARNIYFTNVYYGGYDDRYIGL